MLNNSRRRIVNKYGTRVRDVHVGHTDCIQRLFFKTREFVIMARVLDLFIFLLYTVWC